MARSTKAKAEYLCTVAEGMAGKLRIQREQLMQQVYTPDVIDALRERAEEIERETRLARRKTREAEEELEAYGRSRGMEGMAKEYAEILQETEKVEEEIRPAEFELMISSTPA